MPTNKPNNMNLNLLVSFHIFKSFVFPNKLNTKQCSQSWKGELMTETVTYGGRDIKELVRQMDLFWNSGKTECVCPPWHEEDDEDEYFG